MAEEVRGFIPVACGGCGTTLQAPARLAGRAVKCPRCAAPVQVPGPADAGAPAGPPQVRPVPRPAPGAPQAPLPRRTGPSRLRSRAKPAASGESSADGGRRGKGLPWWIKVPAAIAFIILCGYVAVSSSERTLAREKSACLSRAMSAFADGSRDPALARFLIERLHEDCCRKAMVEVRTSRRGKRWSCGADAYLAAMKAALQAEISNPNSSLVKSFRAQQGP